MSEFELYIVLFGSNYLTKNFSSCSKDSLSSKKSDAEIFSSNKEAHQAASFYKSAYSIKCKSALNDCKSQIQLCSISLKNANNKKAIQALTKQINAIKDRMTKIRKIAATIKSTKVKVIPA